MRRGDEELGETEERTGECWYEVGRKGGREKRALRRPTDNSPPTGVYWAKNRRLRRDIYVYSKGTFT